MAPCASEPHRREDAGLIRAATAPLADVSPDVESPLAVTLSGGGARAAYQVGVLSYIGQRRPEQRVSILTGVSAGAINAAFLAAHDGSFGTAIEALQDNWRSLRPDRVFRSDPVSMFRIAIRWGLTLVSGGLQLTPRARSLVNTEPLYRFLRDSIDPAGIKRNIRSGRLHALAVSVTAYDSGRTTTFVDGSAAIEMWERPLRCSERADITVDHVMASAAIPILFPAIEVEGRYYGDGSIRQSAPLAPAIHLGARRVLAVSSRYPRTVAESKSVQGRGYPPPAQIIGLMLNTIFLDTIDADAARLTRINHTLSRIPEPARRDYPLRPIDLLVLRPTRDLGRLALEYQEKLPRTLRYFVKGLGTEEGRNADFLSYMLFEEGYIGRLLGLGMEDAKHDWSRIERFLDTGRADGDE